MAIRRLRSLIPHCPFTCLECLCIFLGSVRVAQTCYMMEVGCLPQQFCAIQIHTVLFFKLLINPCTTTGYHVCCTDLHYCWSSTSDSTLKGLRKLVDESNQMCYNKPHKNMHPYHGALFHYYYPGKNKTDLACHWWRGEKGSILLRQPTDLVDLLLNFQAFQVIKFSLVALEGAVNIVLPSPLWLVLTLQRQQG